MKKISGECLGALSIVSRRRQDVLNHGFSPVLCQDPIDFGHQMTEESASLCRQNTREEQPSPPEVCPIQRGGYRGSALQVGFWILDFRLCLKNRSSRGN